MDGYLHSRFLLPLMQLRPDLQWKVSTCVEDARMMKTPEEIQLLRHASEVTDDVFCRFLPSAARGHDGAGLGCGILRHLHGARRGPFAGRSHGLLRVGLRGAAHTPGYAKLKPGDTVSVDTGKRIDGYYSDMTRTVFFRSVNDEQRKIYNIVLEANLAALEAIKPGVLMSDIHEAACKVIRDAGYMDYYPHRTSHGIGIDYHEEPFDIVGRPLPVAENMCFSVEPGLPPRPLRCAH